MHRISPIHPCQTMTHHSRPTPPSHPSHLKSRTGPLTNDTIPRLVNVPASCFKVLQCELKDVVFPPPLYPFSTPWAYMQISFFCVSQLQVLRCTRLRLRPLGGCLQQLERQVQRQCYSTVRQRPVSFDKQSGLLRRSNLPHRYIERSGRQARLAATMASATSFFEFTTHDSKSLPLFSMTFDVACGPPFTPPLPTLLYLRSANKLSLQRRAPTSRSPLTKAKPSLS